MTEGIKSDVVQEIKSKVELPEVKVIKNEIKDKFSIFVEQEDTFDAVVEYYNTGAQYLVKGVDENFDIKQDVQKLTVTLRYPSLETFTIVSNSDAASKLSTSGEFSYQTLMGLQMVRMFHLIKSWSLKGPCTNEAIMKLRPKIVKAILEGISKEIGMEGII